MIDDLSVEPQRRGAAAVQVKRNLRPMVQEQLLQGRQVAPFGIALAAPVHNDDQVVQRPQLADGRARLQVSVFHAHNGGIHFHGLPVFYQRRAEFKGMQHALFHQAVCDHPLLFGAIDQHGQIAVFVHNQHLARGVLLAKQLAPADNHAVVVKAAVVAVDGQKRIVPLRDVGKRLGACVKALVGKGIGKLRRICQLNIGGIVDEVILLMPPDMHGDGAGLIVPLGRLFLRRLLRGVGCGRVVRRRERGACLRALFQGNVFKAGLSRIFQRRLNVYGLLGGGRRFGRLRRTFRSRGDQQRNGQQQHAKGKV